MALPLTRTGTVALTDCPRCKAAKGEPCVGKRGVREAAHRERWNRARLLRGNG